jgi:hypothetical protein
MSHPFIEQSAVGRFHQLVARSQVIYDPARYIHKAFGGHTASLLESFIYRPGLAIAEVLDDHEKRHV